MRRTVEMPRSVELGWSTLVWWEQGEIKDQNSTPSQFLKRHRFEVGDFGHGDFRTTFHLVHGNYSSSSATILLCVRDEQVQPQYSQSPLDTFFWIVISCSPAAFSISSVITTSYSHNNCPWLNATLDICWRSTNIAELGRNMVKGRHISRARNYPWRKSRTT